MLRIVPLFLVPYRLLVRSVRLQPAYDTLHRVFGVRWLVLLMLGHASVRRERYLNVTDDEL